MKLNGRSIVDRSNGTREIRIPPGLLGVKVTLFEAAVVLCERFKQPLSSILVHTEERAAILSFGPEQERALVLFQTDSTGETTFHITFPLEDCIKGREC